MPALSLAAVLWLPPALPALLLLSLTLMPVDARAEPSLRSISPYRQQVIAASGGHDKALPPEEEDYTGNPFTQYGEYNQQQDEDEEIRFLQNGRLFGVSVGAGAEGAFGNRGKLWTGGFPLLEVKLHYWFDFHLALDLGFFTVKHAYDISALANNGTADHFSVTMNHLGADLKYYFDTKDLAAPLSFANPYAIVGAGSFTKIETSQNNNADQNTDSGFGINAGLGLEFVLQPKKVYLETEAKLHTVSFADTDTDKFAPDQLPDLNGLFWTFTVGFLFTW